MKKIVSLLLATVMAITIFPLNMFADDIVVNGSCGENLTWELTSDGTLTISGTGEMDDYGWVYDETAGASTYVGAPWYENHQNSIKKVVIANGITKIGQSAFAGCWNLASVEIPNSLTTIGQGAFSDCSGLTSIDIPANVTNLEYNNVFFNNNSLTNINVADDNPNYSDINGVLFNKNATFLICYPAGRTDTTYTIPDSVKEINTSAFCACTLTNIDIPVGVLNLGLDTFVNCVNLERITFLSPITHINRNERAIPTSAAIYGYSGSTAEEYATEYNREFVSLGQAPITIIDSGVCGENLTWSLTSVGTLTVSGTGEMTKSPLDNWNRDCLSTIRDIIIENGVTSIGQDAFGYLTRLTSVELPNSVTYIGENAFWGCSSLTSIEIPASVATIDFGVFQSCSSLTSITFLSPITQIYDYSSTIPKTATIYGYSGSPAEDYATKYNRAFVSLGEVTVASGECGESLTWKLTSRGILTISGTGDMYDYGPVYDDNYNLVSDISAPWGEYCDLIKSIVLPDGLTSIGSRAFQRFEAIGDGRYLSDNIKNVTSIDIPASVLNIADNVFASITNLQTINIADTNPNYSDINGVLFDKNATTIIFHPKGKTDTTYTIPTSVTSIGDSAFEQCTNLTSIEIPDSVTYIGMEAFSNCLGLTSIEIPNSVTTIDQNAFFYCTGLTSIEIPASVATIDFGVFQSCSSLTSITFLSPITQIYDIPWTIPETATIYGYTGSTAEDYATKYNRAFVSLGEAPITTVDFGTCGENLTWELTSDGTLTISGTGDMDDYGGFWNDDDTYTDIATPWEDYNSAIKSIVIENGVTSIGQDAFGYLTRLTSVEIPNSVTYIGENAFWGCSSLTSIEIPASVATIDFGVFQNCSSLTSITFLSSNTQIFDDSSTIPKTATIYGYTYSPVEDYATKYNRAFVSIGEAPITTVDFGTCGENLTWELTSDGTLTISGTGEMDNYGPIWDWDNGGNLAGINKTPWGEYRDVIQNIVLTEGIRSIGENAFAWFGEYDDEGYTVNGLYLVENITIPASVLSVGAEALSNLYNLQSVTFLSPMTQIAGNSGWNIPETATIYGYTGSTAEDYATKYNRAFVSIGEIPLETIDQGSCGENLTWTFDSRGTLTISGTGAMYEYGYDDEWNFIPAPWADWIDFAKKLVVENGVTELSDDMLHGEGGGIRSRIESIYLPASLTRICEDFDYLGNLRSITIDKKNETYAVVDNVLYTKDMANMLVYPRNKEGSHYSMPDTVQQMGRLLYNHNIKSLVLSRNLISFEDIDFCGSLSHITFLNPNTVFPDWAIQEYAGLEDSVVIYGFDGSTAQKHAQKYRLTFIDLTEKTGELTFDGEVDREDALRLLYNSIFGNEDYTIYQDCDYNDDGVIDRDDAIYLLYHSIFPEDYPL